MTWILAGSQPTRVVIGPSLLHKAVLNVHDENELSHDDVCGLMNLTRFSFPEILMYHSFSHVISQNVNVENFSTSWSDGMGE